MSSGTLRRRPCSERSVGVVVFVSGFLRGGLVPTELRRHVGLPVNRGTWVCALLPIISTMTPGLKNGVPSIVQRVGS